MELTIHELKQENKELKQALALLMNVGLVKKLSDALNRVKSGQYLSEEEFFKNSPR